MNYNRVFYTNIIYRCNNNCINCISHNTANKSKDDIFSMEDLARLHEEENICSSDLFIISGGEPTLSPYFESIVNYLKTLNCNIVIYTNGTNLIKQELLDYPNLRLIVPLYGLEKSHNQIIRNQTGFYRTTQFLKNCSLSEKIDLKILISDETNYSEILSIILKYRNNCKRIHISGITDKTFRPIFSKYSDIANIINFMITEKIEFKLSNIPLCRLNCIMKILESNDIKTLFSSNRTFFVNNRHLREINYNKPTNWYKKCKNCKFNKVCTNTNLKYPVLLIKEKKVFLEEE